MSSYSFGTTNEFDKAYKKYSVKNPKLKRRIDEAVITLVNNPFYPGLRTHKVNTKNYGVRYSSRVTGDIRIIWDFFENNTVLLLLTIGGHSGNRGIYE